ncbi:MAG: carboxylase [Bacteroidales bacterium]|jgi:pyruvate/oxaloacetate carboxyltransferase|nr:carboxylase [Bacteroidales bacterium]MDD2204172.1 carboxylase [Bacteroidales bacterium]MDD3152047.1 carboxylase [Bacteroidales bacterium]MDD3914743.1 carboxylase [Bacteroidales bacterium]MDD4633601.1 carboxylase [Bacteroidales bacterium]
MNKSLKIRDLTLRDGQQSLFATRMNQAQVNETLDLFSKAGFYAMEVWGGAVPDSVMRYLGEDPWERLGKIKKVIGNNSKLTALSRGRNLFGYNPYPSSVIEGFNRNAIQGGIDIMRIFDALNDTDNMTYTIKVVKENGGLADCAVCYTVDPKFTWKQRFKSTLKGKKLPAKIFNIDYFVNKAIQLEKAGADMISVKDMAGLVPPRLAGKLVESLKNAVKVPIDFHTHCTPGYGVASSLMAILHGADILDTAIVPFAGGPAAPPYEIMYIFAKKLGIKMDGNPEIILQISDKLFQIKKELSNLDNYKEKFSKKIDIVNMSFPKEIDELFDKAIAAAKADNEEELLANVHKIEEFFDFPAPNEMVKNAEIPGGMYTNMLAQLKTANLSHLVSKVLETVPEVRVSAGCPPLVTPTSQIVGSQAVNCVVNRSKDLPPFTNPSVQYANLVKGKYGKTPIPVDPDFREQICGVREEIPFEESDYVRPENLPLPEFNGEKIAQSERDMLLLELFPAVAKPFLTARLQLKYDKIKSEEAERYRKARAEYEAMTPEQKTARLMEGLYQYPWISEF